jgi:hypothetical protein
VNITGSLSSLGVCSIGSVAALQAQLLATLNAPSTMYKLRTSLKVVFSSYNSSAYQGPVSVLRRQILFDVGPTCRVIFSNTCENHSKVTLGLKVSPEGQKGSIRTERHITIPTEQWRSSKFIKAKKTRFGKRKYNYLTPKNSRSCVPLCVN